MTGSIAVDTALLALKIGFLVLIYLFIWMIVRSATRDVRAAPQESIVINVYFSDVEIWTGFPRPKNATEEVTMRAIFTNEPDEHTKEQNVWTGRLATKPLKYTFERWQQK